MQNCCDDGDNDVVYKDVVIIGTIRSPIRNLYPLGNIYTCTRIQKIRKFAWCRLKEIRFLLNASSFTYKIILKILKDRRVSVSHTDRSNLLASSVIKFDTMVFSLIDFVIR